ncbi:MAG: hypothetical protein HC866_20830 [Leptolyngbyaceae cyanobacterium RU_5_1]|nr:hypothetical protein [Leptolyngbyaceae cyanobacterium RU_5_1]
MDKKADKKLVSFRLPEDLLQELRARADEDGISVTELVFRLLRQGLQASVDDRIAGLEAEIQELRRQYKQVNFSGISSVPVYSPVFPQAAIAHEGDIETKQRIANLETQMKEGIAKLESMMEEVLAVQEPNSGSSKRSQDDSRRGNVA